MTSSRTEPSGFETMAESMEFADNYNNWIVQKFSPYIGKSILEIGTGQGNFKKFFGNKVDNYVSLDIDADVISRASQRDPDGIYLVGDIATEKFVKDTINYNIDTVLCVNVLEHVTDHQTAFNNMISVLRKGGHLLLFVPAFMHLYNDLDKLAGHHRRYTKQMARELTRMNSNCEVVTLEYFNPVGAFGWWINKFVTHKNINSNNVNSQVKFFDKYVMPVSKFSNPIFKSFWGQSLVAVFKKK